MKPRSAGHLHVGHHQMAAADDILAAHTHCVRHRNEIRASDLCGCFYCVAIFPPSDIEDWLEEGPGNTTDVTSTGETALCPKCGIDSVVGSASGFPITTEFLQRMKEYWF